MANKTYITNLDWGDGSPKEFVSNPSEFIDGRDVYDHVYEKPGFYSITGLIYEYDEELERVVSWERFKSNMIVNQSDIYDSPFIDNQDMAMIGGYNEESSYFKTLLINGGYDFNKEKKSDIKELDLNEFDKINLMNTIMKFDSKLYNDILNPYTGSIYSNGELIHNNFSNKKQYDILANTNLNNMDVGSCKMYNGVRRMHMHFGFNNSHPAADPNEDEYWKNIIPKEWRWTDKEGIEYGTFREPTSGSKALIEEYKEYQIDDSAEQNWQNGYWPVLPTIDKYGKFVSEITSSYGITSAAIGEPEGQGGERNLIMDIDFNQNSVDDLIDKTSQFEIKNSFDFSLILDSKNRIEKNQIDNIELIEKKNLEQPY